MRTPGDPKCWYWTPASTLPLAAQSAGPSDPFLTVFWNGATDGASLRQFFGVAAPTIASDHELRYTAFVMKGEEERQSEAEPMAPVPDELIPNPDFVRFECFFAVDSAADLTFGAWARLDHPGPEELDAIGVRLPAERLPALSGQLSQFIAQTMDRHPPPSEVSHLLSRLTESLSSAKERDIPA